MRRRAFLCSSLMAILPVYTGMGEAQRPEPRRVGVLYGAPIEATLGQQRAFDEALNGLGHHVGRSVLVTHRGTNPLPEDINRAAHDLVASRPDVIVAWSTIGAVAIKRTLTTIPVVFLSVGSPVEIGLVSSLARPGGTMTGVAAAESTEAHGKRLQLLQEIVPRLSRVAVLYALGDPNGSVGLESAHRAAPSLGLQILPVAIESGSEVETALRSIRTQAQGVLVISGGLTWTNRIQIATLALSNKFPSAYGHPDNVVAGGLISLGTDLIDTARQGALYVDRILRGTKPADLPVQQPRKYDLHINARTAKALGLTIPPSLLARADQVVE